MALDERVEVGGVGGALELPHQEGVVHSLWLEERLAVIGLTGQKVVQHQTETKEDRNQAHRPEVGHFTVIRQHHGPPESRGLPS